MGLCSFFQQLFAQDVLSTKDAIEQSEKRIQKLISKKQIPGLSVTVTYKNEVIWESGYGVSDIKQNTEVNPQQTLFRIASISKNLSSAGLGLLMQEGYLDVDDSFYKYVPEYPKKNFDFTIKQLASHTAGIRGYKGNEFLNDLKMPIAQGLNMFAQDPLLYKPGTLYLYNSNDWNMIGYAIERIAEVNFEEYMQLKVIEPLGLAHTFADDSEKTFPNKATFYTRKRRRGFRKAEEVDNYYKLPSGGFLSTSHDIALFGNAMLYHSLLNKNVQDQLLTAQYVNGESTYYGLGWEVTMDAQHRHYYGHVGNGVGGYGYLRVYPKEEVVIVFLMNVTNPKVDATLKEIINLIFQGLAADGVKNQDN